MGAARATVTKDWSYIAVRYTKDQIATIKKAMPQNLPRAMSYIGRLGIGVRGADRPGFFDEDQLYHLKSDPKEMNNLAYHNPDQATRIKEMRRSNASKTSFQLVALLVSSLPAENTQLNQVRSINRSKSSNNSKSKAKRSRCQQALKKNLRSLLLNQLPIDKAKEKSGTRSA